MRKMLFCLSLAFTSFVAASPAQEASSSQEVFSQNIEKKVITIDLKSAFQASPIIYSVLLGLSIASMTIALSALFDMQKRLNIPHQTLEKTKEKLITCSYDEACQTLNMKSEAIAFMVKEMIENRKMGFMAMKEAAKYTGKRQTLPCWQKLSLLSDIAILSPMIGLLGTVLGMFYAFYDVNRSIESLASLFDGLGVSVGTTVAGLLVALLSMFFQTFLKHRLISQTSKVEEACDAITQFVGRP